MICRVCLSFDVTLKYVNCNFYSEYFVKIAHIEENSSVDSYLCHVCAYSIQKSLKLRQQVIEADLLLQKIYSKTKTEHSANFDSNLFTSALSNVVHLSTYSPLCLEVGEFMLKDELFEFDDGNLFFETKFDVFVPQAKHQTDENVGEHSLDDIKQPYDCTDSDVDNVEKSRPLNKKRIPLNARAKTKSRSQLASGKNTGIADYSDKIVVISLNRDEQLAELKLLANKESYKESLFKCELCYLGFGFKETYDGHMMKHDKLNGGFECDVCHCVFRTRHSLDSHVRYVHCKRYACSECRFVRTTKMLVVEHYQTEHDNSADKKPFICSVCGDAFVKYSALRRHAWKEHKSPGPLQCDHCEKVLANSSSLRSHVNSVHSSERPFECESCGMRFVTRTHLRTHSAKHSSRRNYYCAECDVCFKSELTYKGHMKYAIKHLDADSFRQCPQCPSRFPTNLALDNHMHKVHMNVRRFTCALCPKAFFSMSALSHHKARVHEGRLTERKYTCEMCGKNFSAKKTLRLHINTHTGARPYKCTVCEASFSHDASLYTHNRLVHLKLKKKPQVRKKKPYHAADYFTSAVSSSKTSLIV